MSELVPCPFCGGEPEVETFETESLWSHNIVTYTSVGCPECDINFSTEPDHAIQAVDLWNQRVPVPNDAVNSVVEKAADIRFLELAQGSPWTIIDRQMIGELYNEAIKFRNK